MTVLKLISPPVSRGTNIILMARVDENDQLGYLTVEKALPWGKITKPSTYFLNKVHSCQTGSIHPTGFYSWQLFCDCSLGNIDILIYSVYQAKKTRGRVTIFAVFTFRYRTWKKCNPTCPHSSLLP